MKLTIGENIRHFRKKNDLTQEMLAARLGVTYQSISRWENGTTYPDLELIPAIAEILAITVDDLLGMPQIQKEKRAQETFDALRRECMKQEYDADKIVMILRDIRRNYLDSKVAWRPWCERNERAFRDPRILPEVRLLAEAYFDREPMSPHVIQAMAIIEEEDHLEEFLQKHTTSFDCSVRALLFNRYLLRNDNERFEAERKYQLFRSIDTLLSQRYLIKQGETIESQYAADEFTEKLMTLLRCNAVDDSVDMWVSKRLEQGFGFAARCAALGKIEDAILKLESTVRLFEKTMEIKEEIVLPTSCCYLDGMQWLAKEAWDTRDNNPDSPKERYIIIETKMSGMVLCHRLFPSAYFDKLQGKEFETLRRHPKFEKLCERVRARIVTRPTEE
ncbi:MAG: helix-turn-helix transcriptional regulator [Oscillospiraceae bacterium]|nr:helix-turn-helix transcriptional regulator [Oscillospiraceae bacterium]